jgi:hypothetical protein
MARPAARALLELFITLVISAQAFAVSALRKRAFF